MTTTWLPEIDVHNWQPAEHTSTKFDGDGLYSFDFGKGGCFAANVTWNIVFARFELEDPFTRGNMASMSSACFDELVTGKYRML